MAQSWQEWRRAGDRTSTDNPSGTSATVKMMGGGRSQRDFLGTMKGPVSKGGMFDPWHFESSSVDPVAAMKLRKYLEMNPAGYDFISSLTNQESTRNSRLGMQSPPIVSPHNAQMAFISMMEKALEKQERDEKFKYMVANNDYKEHEKVLNKMHG